MDVMFYQIIKENLLNKKEQALKKYGLRIRSTRISFIPHGYSLMSCPGFKENFIYKTFIYNSLFINNYISDTD